MDTTDPDIVFDVDGVCSHRHRYNRVAGQRLAPLEGRSRKFASLVTEIKAVGEGKPFDCVIGVSGGIDTTHVAHIVNKLGLRPFAIHLDNGWNFELTVANIQKTLEKLSIDLRTHVIDWIEFRDLQLSCLKAATPDGEIPTDLAIFALLYTQAAKHGLRHDITDTNSVTEAILLEKWGYGYFGWIYIRNVYKRFGCLGSKSYPHFSPIGLTYCILDRKIKIPSILNPIDCNKKATMDILRNGPTRVYYRIKNYYPIYTRFYQSLYLQNKFKLDKRKEYYSNLVLWGQMTDDEALSAMQGAAHPKNLIEEDYDYVTKKPGLKPEEMEGIIASPNKTFGGYKTNHSLSEPARRLANTIRPRIG